MRSEPYGPNWIRNLSLEDRMAMQEVLQQNKEDEIEKVYCRKLTRNEQKFCSMERQFELVEKYMGTILSKKDKEFIIRLRRSL